MPIPPLFNDIMPPDPNINWNLLEPNFGHYQIIEKLAGFPTMLTWGDIHRTYRVNDTRLQREGRMFITPSPHLAQLVIQNIPAIAQLSHPSLEPIWDYGQLAHYTYFVSPPEYGQRLNEQLGQPFDPRVAAYIMDDLAAILTYLHGRNIVHGSVIPIEILLNDRVILKNTGLKQLVHIAEARWGEENSEIGVFTYDTKNLVNYEAPENNFNYFMASSNYALSAQSDQYQLAMVGYIMLAGTAHYHTKDQKQLNLQLAKPIPEPFSYNPNFPRAAWTILQKALSNNPQDRYDSVAEFNRAFQQTIYNNS